MAKLPKNRLEVPSNRLLRRNGGGSWTLRTHASPCMLMYLLTQNSLRYVTYATPTTIEPEKRKTSYCSILANSFAEWFVPNQNTNLHTSELTCDFRFSTELLNSFYSRKVFHERESIRMKFTRVLEWSKQIHDENYVERT